MSSVSHGSRGGIYPGPFALDAERSAAGALPLWAAIAIIAAYILPALVGHDPWKQDEAYIFGGILDMVKDGDWVVVKVGGVPFMEKPPLYHWMGALCAWIFSPWLALHDAARLASGVFVGIAAGAVAFASNLLWGPGRGRVGALMTLSALGLFTNAQMMIPDLPLMAGFALALAGWAGCHRDRLWGGILLGVGVGVGFLGKGVFAPAVLGVAALALPVFFPAWRTRRYARALYVALAAAMPFLVAWPLALWLRSPELFNVWFWDNNVGRYLGFSVPYLGAATEEGFWLETWPWFLFPLWVIVGAALLRGRARLLRHPGAQIGLVVSACIAGVLATSASARAIYALPMIPALALAAAGCDEEACVRTDRRLFAAAIVFAGVVGLAVWYCWASLAITAQAPDWPWLTRFFPAEFALRIAPLKLACAGALTAGFIVACIALRDAPHRGIAAWVAAMGMAWGLVALLWFPWIDHAKSYRAMYESLARSIPAEVDCVASLEIGESERAVLEYVLGIPTYDSDRICMAVLRQRHADKVERPMPASWRRVWSGARPGDHRERFELWLRERPARAALRRETGA